MPNIEQEENVGEASVIVTNLTDTGFTVLWISKEREQGYVKYGISQSNLSNTENDERDDMFSRNRYFVHSVKLSRLRPETEYFFNVVSGEEEYDNGGKHFSVTTFKTLNTPPGFEFSKGQLLNLPEHKEAVILANIKDTDSAGSGGISNIMSSLVDENGYWSLSLSSMRTENGESYFEFTEKDLLQLKTYTTQSPIEKEITLSQVEKEEISIDLEGSTEQTEVIENDKNTTTEQPIGKNTIPQKEISQFDIMFLTISILLFVLLGGMYIYLRSIIKKEKKDFEKTENVSKVILDKTKQNEEYKDK
ncbi:fibronectin type III domain-containing protein [Candidatus Dojkabacteria bacterium]|jgi:hypothetical protein|nr:fibronectin type III domain-containing protein [Candidatus Dojkabacteria bacterium]